MRKAALTLTVILALSVLLMPRVQIAMSSSKTITVPDNYSTIQDAIDNANSGDTIFVKSGVYTGNLVINKSLALIGNNKDTTQIVGDKTGTTLLINHDDVTITGFTIKSPDGFLSMWDRKRGIHLLHASNCNISGNNVLRNEFNDGIWLYGASGNIISGNTVEGGHTGILIDHSSSNSIINNTVLANNAGIYLCNANFSSFQANLLINNDYGICIHLSNSNLFYANNITSNEAGVQFGGLTGIIEEDRVYTDNNIFHHNNFFDTQKNFNTWYTVVGVTYLDDGKEGNYYSDYAGEDRNHDGIGDSPYVIFQDTNRENTPRKDNHPLMFPVDTSALLLNPLPNPTPTPEPFPIALPIAIAILVIIVTITLVVVILKKRKQNTCENFRKGNMP